MWKRSPAHACHMNNTLVIGASLSGLASAACLQKYALDYRIIEKDDKIAAPWHTHYDRLHLHTHKNGSNLPRKKFPSNIPKYPGRQQLIEYAEEYRRAFDIQPLFRTEALSISKADDGWLTETTNGSYRSKYLIMATGAFSKPLPLDFPGLETFPGEAIHSSRYRTGKRFQGKKVLVVGFGNSACEIAIDLVEQGAFPTMAVRSPVNVVPRDILGLPIVKISLLLGLLPPRLADKLSGPLLRLLIGDITALGLKKMPYGPLEQIRRDLKAPILDIGAIEH
ncbi:MAG TPA: NAD(P)/FAD-dependent oxidoreductase, partial [Puia sp.]|nr:NAD(P)/FAD-dependent oxidoreductase [Puia sp.]